MASYVVADIEVTDSDEYQKYAKQVRAIIEQYGGKFVVRGGQPEVLEGDWETRRIVVVEFPSVEQAKAWYNSPEYTAIIGIRQRASVSRLILLHDD